MKNQTTSMSAILSAILEKKDKPSNKSMCYWIYDYEIV